MAIEYDSDGIRTICFFVSRQEGVGRKPRSLATHTMTKQAVITIGTERGMAFNCPLRKLIFIK
jgi:hypothetical protein